MEPQPINNDNTEISYATRLKLFRDAILLLTRYMVNPVDTTNMILNSDLEMKEKFEDVKTELTGEFTKVRAAEIGRNLILKHIETLAKNLKKEKIELTPFIESLHKDAHTAYRTLNNNVDIDTLDRRKEKYVSHYMYTDYFKTKLTQVIATKLTNFPSVLDNRNLLFGFREILSMLSLYNQDDLNKKFKIFSYRTEFLANNYIAIGTPNFKDEKFNVEVTPTAYTVDGLITKYLEKVLKDQTFDEDDYTIFNSIVDIMERTLNNIKENIDKLYSTVNSYTSQSELFDTIIDNVYNKMVIPFSKSEIITEDFSKRYKDALSILDNLHSVEEELKTFISNIYQKLYTDLEVYGRIYSIVDEITLVGTIREK